MKRLFSKNVLPILIVALVIPAFFLPNLIRGKIPIPADSLLGLYHPWRDITFDEFEPGKFPVKNPLITDPILQIYPWKFAVVENLKDGSLPLWNPYNFSGQPLLANVQSAPFFFLNFVLLVLPFKIGWAITIILPLVLSGIFMYMFLTSLKLSKLSSAFGSLVLPFSAFFVAWMTWGGITSAAMFLPLILFCINKLFDKVSPFIFLILTFATCQLIFSGHFQTGFYVILACLLFTAYKFVTKHSTISTVIVLIALFLGVAISSIHLLPSLEFINLSNRTTDQVYLDGRKDWFLPYQHMIQLVAPDFFGNPSTYNYWGVWNYAEFVSFIGIVPLILAGISFFSKNRKILFFAFLAIFSLMLAVENPISKIPFNLNIPLISSMQPSRIVFLISFSLVCLSAFGLETLKNEKSKKNFPLIPILTFAILLLLILATIFLKELFPPFAALDPANIAFRNLLLPFSVSLITLILFTLIFLKFPKKIIILSLFVVSIFELFRFTYKFTPFSKPSWIFPQTETIKFLQAQKKPFRTITTDRRILHPNTNASYKIESTQGYDPLYLKDYAKLVSFWQSNELTDNSSFNRIVTPTNYDSKIADFVNVKYILSFDEIENKKLSKVFEEGQTKVYENQSALPRAYFVENIIKVDSANLELQRLNDENFDLKKNAVSSDFSFETKANEATATIDKYSDQSIILQVDTKKKAPLVTSTVYYPGWNVFIDDKKTDVQKVNFMFQSVIIPEGKHKVEFKYRPKSFYNGVYISTVSVLATLIVALLLWRRKFQ